MHRISPSSRVRAYDSIRVGPKQLRFLKLRSPPRHSEWRPSSKVPGSCRDQHRRFSNSIGTLQKEDPLYIPLSLSMYRQTWSKHYVCLLLSSEVHGVDSSTFVSNLDVSLISVLLLLVLLAFFIQYCVLYSYFSDFCNFEASFLPFYISYFLGGLVLFQGSSFLISSETKILFVSPIGFFYSSQLIGVHKTQKILVADVILDFSNEADGNFIWFFLRVKASYLRLAC